MFILQQKLKKPFPVGKKQNNPRVMLRAHDVIKQEVKHVTSTWHVYFTIKLFGVYNKMVKNEIENTI